MRAGKLLKSKQLCGLQVGPSNLQDTWVTQGNPWENHPSRHFAKSHRNAAKKGEIPEPWQACPKGLRINSKGYQRTNIWA